MDKASGQFFARVNDAQYDAIYDDAADPFKNQNARATVLDDLQKFAALGRPQQWSRLSMSFGMDGTNRVALPVYSVHSDWITSEVSFKFIDVRGEWKLMGFAVRPHNPGAQ